MIKPINVSRLYTTNQCYYECVKCGDKNTITWSNRIINIDNVSEMEDLKNENCPKCGNNLA